MLQTELLQVEYTSTQLDFLALLFTVVKLLYIGGALPRCARVVHLLDAASRASAQELHKTLIRNEAAYFGCVKQLVLQHPPPPQPQPAATPPLYLCGDSHCLSVMHSRHPPFCNLPTPPATRTVLLHLSDSHRQLEHRPCLYAGVRMLLQPLLSCPTPQTTSGGRYAAPTPV